MENLPISSQKSDRFHLRMTPFMKDILKKAAALEGYSSLADFLVSSAYREAARVIKDHDVISLTQQDQYVFVQTLSETLDTGQTYGNSLKEAAQKYLEFKSK